MKYRNLTSSEISALENSGCTSRDWKNISVSENFSPAKIRNVNFNGEVFLGENVEINNVFNLAGYRIEDNVAIRNVDSLSVDGETTFGNGTKISVLNEGGGRELIMFDRLSSQIAYMLVTCRHDNAFVETAERFIHVYCESKKSSTGLIGSGTSISHCGIIKDVWIEGPAKIEGISCLSTGTILSSTDDPVKISNGVTAKHFIIQSGTIINDGALIDNCFIGQGVRIGKQYSAENSAFFSNCEGFHGEAVSIFAGPYTVTHHKSSLLIAAMFSFYNAGSGSNQSNHMYKLGPLHQGILERGSKTGSFSYMLWPSRVGAFSVVIGKHYTNFDAGDFPFSYINEEDGKSLLTPAMNMFTVGTRRDSQKWPARDRRKDTIRFDILNFDLLNPYIIGKIISGSNIMKELLEKASKEQEYVTYKGLHIKRLLLKTCGKYYEMAIKIFIGQQVIKKLEQSDKSLPAKEALKDNPSLFCESWVDAAGMLIPKANYDNLIKEVKAKKIDSIDGFITALKETASEYAESSWAWCANLIKTRFGAEPSGLSREQLVQIINDWKENSIKLNNMILKDAEKEFDQSSKIGFGVDGGADERDADFNNVRDTYADNKFVLELNKESKEIANLAEKLIGTLN